MMLACILATTPYRYRLLFYHRQTMRDPLRWVLRQSTRTVVNIIPITESSTGILFIIKPLWFILARVQLPRIHSPPSTNVHPIATERTIKHSTPIPTRQTHILVHTQAPPRPANTLPVRVPPVLSALPTMARVAQPLSLLESVTRSTVTLPILVVVAVPQPKLISLPFSTDTLQEEINTNMSPRTLKCKMSVTSVTPKDRMAWTTLANNSNRHLPRPPKNSGILTTTRDTGQGMRDIVDMGSDTLVDRLGFTHASPKNKY